MIVMYHKFGYEKDQKRYQLDANMVVVGESARHTAMAKTVGLPVGIATLLILKGKIREPGVQIPIRREIYHPVLSSLKNYGIRFREYEVPYLGYNPDSVGN
jgi:saccharopine dehydrogenase-like NADP-dependent oxidoreductase